MRQTLAGLAPRDHGPSTQCPRGGGPGPSSGRLQVTVQADIAIYRRAMERLGKPPEESDDEIVVHVAFTKEYNPELWAKLCRHVGEG